MGNISNKIPSLPEPPRGTSTSNVQSSRQQPPSKEEIEDAEEKERIAEERKQEREKRREQKRLERERREREEELERQRQEEREQQLAMEDDMRKREIEEEERRREAEEAKRKEREKRASVAHPPPVPGFSSEDSKSVTSIYPFMQMAEMQLGLSGDSVSMSGSLSVYDNNVNIYTNMIPAIPSRAPIVFSTTHGQGCYDMKELFIKTNDKHKLKYQSLLMLIAERFRGNDVINVLGETLLGPNLPYSTFLDCVYAGVFLGKGLDLEMESEPRERADDLLNELREVVGCDTYTIPYGLTTGEGVGILYIAESSEFIGNVPKNVAVSIARITDGPNGTQKRVTNCIYVVGRGRDSQDEESVLKECQKCRSLVLVTNSAHPGYAPMSFFDANRDMKYDIDRKIVAVASIVTPDIQEHLSKYVGEACDGKWGKYFQSEVARLFLRNVVEIYLHTVDSRSGTSQFAAQHMYDTATMESLENELVSRDNPKPVMSVEEALKTVRERRKNAVYEPLVDVDRKRHFFYTGGREYHRSS